MLSAASGPIIMLRKLSVYSAIVARVRPPAWPARAAAAWVPAGALADLRAGGRRCQAGSWQHGPAWLRVSAPPRLPGGNGSIRA
jgi:hypothetical protein